MGEGTQNLREGLEARSKLSLKNGTCTSKIEVENINIQLGKQRGEVMGRCLEASFRQVGNVQLEENFSQISAGTVSVLLSVLTDLHCGDCLLGVRVGSECETPGGPFYPEILCSRPAVAFLGPKFH